MRGGTMGAVALALALTGALTPPLAPEARADTSNGSPFPVVAVQARRPPSYTWAYVTLGAGAALVGGSFGINNQANADYERYLAATEPVAIGRFFDRASRNDRIASGCLLSGEALIAAGIYLRFLHPAEDARIALSLRPGRCALALRF